MEREDTLDLILLYCFESPKKNWTLLTFGQQVEGDCEIGMKPIERWYPTKNIKNIIPPEVYGQVVKATIQYRTRPNDVSKAESVVSKFEVNNAVYNLV